MLKVIIIFVLVEQYGAVSNFMRVFTKYDVSDEQLSELPNLLYYVTSKYLSSCTPYILYDDLFYETIIYRDALFSTLENFKSTSIIHGYIDHLNMAHLYNGTGRQTCFNFVVLANDFEIVLTKLDFQLTNRVVLVTTMSNWQVKDFIESPIVRNIQHLLVICDPILQKEQFLRKTKSKDINMYTHKLHIDGIGSSGLKILTAWRNNCITRPEVNLFPPKLDEGLNGHRLVVSAYEQPPFVMRKKENSRESGPSDLWDGLEVRLLKMIADPLNISLHFQDTLVDTERNATDAVINTVASGRADLGIMGLYITRRYYHSVYYSLSHSQDCATFITLSSTAIPKYRAILGPFQWGVWVCVIFIYMLAIIPIAFSIKYSCCMFEDFGEVGTMLWMVFGTFTNLFTYRGEKSWGTIKTNSTRTVIGTYWTFTIIITAAYSSSIISFITIPNYYEVVDSVKDLLKEEYKIGVLDTRDWTTMFNDTTDYSTNKLLKHVDILNTSIQAFEKVRTKEKYAFLNSQKFLENAVRSNFTYRSSDRKKAMYHIVSQCLVPFMVSFVMKPKTDFLIKFDQQIQRFHENGLIGKITRDMNWDISRTGKGRLFMVSSGGLRSEAPEDRQLTVDDMQGMFLLLGIGVVMAGASLLRELYMGYECRDPGSVTISRRTSVPSIILTGCDNTDRKLSVSCRFSSMYIRPLSATIQEGFNSMKASLRRFSR